MRWEKLGLALPPDESVRWMSRYAASSFVRVTEGHLEILVSGRDHHNESRIGRVRAEWDGRLVAITHVDSEPLLDVGTSGCFDESGVTAPWLIEVGDRLHMYYVGWVAGGKCRFQINLGLAVSEDGGGTWVRASRAPILPMTDEEPFGTGSCCVMRSESGFEMYYTAFEAWEQVGDRMEPRYRIKQALSDDGVTWTRTGRVVVDFADPDETVVGKPMVLDRNGQRHLWYSHRGDSYRIGYARRDPGGGFRRRDREVGLATSSGGWDSEMVEYAFVFRTGSDVLMAYNGNQYGRTGLGFARLLEW